MEGSVQLLAGEAIAAIRGHVIQVAGYRVRVAPDGRLTVPGTIADRLLAQSGWSRYKRPEPSEGIKGMTSGGHSAPDSFPRRRRGRPRKTHL